jgi:hypothetical protein
MEFTIIPNYVDEILVDNSVTHQRLIRKAIRYAKQNFDETLDYAFDESGECPIEMAFYDGIAISTDGCGLYMTYPTMAKVSKSETMQDNIQDYTGIYDGTINQHDVALCYGVLKFTETGRNNVVKTKDMYYKEHETLILMSADIFNDVYNMTEVCDYNLAASLVRDAALRFEKKWWEMKADDKDDMLDYIIEMEKFEQEELARLRDLYDFPEPDDEDDPDDDPNGDLDDEPADPLIEKCNNLTKAALELVDELTK